MGVALFSTRLVANLIFDFSSRRISVDARKSSPVYMYRVRQDPQVKMSIGKVWIKLDQAGIISYVQCPGRGWAKVGWPVLSHVSQLSKPPTCANTGQGSHLDKEMLPKPSSSFSSCLDGVNQSHLDHVYDLLRLGSLSPLSSRCCEAPVPNLKSILNVLSFCRKYSKPGF